MDDKDKKEYKPFLATDKDYLKKVAGTIKEKAPLEEIKFELLNEAIQSLGFDVDPYSSLDPQDLKVESIQAIIDKTFEKVQSGISEEQKEKLRSLWDYLAEEDPIEKSDLIFVFGGPGLKRVNEAVELYKKSLAPKILFTGQRAAYMKDVDISEAEYYYQIAREQGVSEDAMIIEKEAKNTPENAVNSVRILKEKNFLPATIILITLPYHMRRSYLTFKAVADWSPKLIRHVAESAKFKREDYFMNKDGWSYIFNEFIKLYGARLMKHF